MKKNEASKTVKSDALTIADIQALETRLIEAKKAVALQMLEERNSLKERLQAIDSTR